MGWTGSAPVSASTHGEGEGPGHAPPASSGPTYAPPPRPEEAPPRMSGPTSPPPEHLLQAPAPAPAPEPRPQVAWSSTPPPAGDHGQDGPARED
jgi:hypothetical protein